MVWIIENRRLASRKVANKKNIPPARPDPFDGNHDTTHGRAETMALGILGKPSDEILWVHQACGIAFIVSFRVKVPSPFGLPRKKRSHRQAAATFIRISLSFRFEGLMR